MESPSCHPAERGTPRCGQRSSRAWTVRDRSRNSTRGWFSSVVPTRRPGRMWQLSAAMYQKPSSIDVLYQNCCKSQSANCVYCGEVQGELRRWICSPERDGRTCVANCAEARALHLPNRCGRIPVALPLQRVPDGEDCLKFRSSKAQNGTSSAAEQM